MRRLEFLIKTIRSSTDLGDTNTVKDNEMIEYFNAGQKRMQSLIFQADAESDLFDKEAFYDLVANQKDYSLPSDIYAKSSVTGVERLVTSAFMPIDKITQSERSTLVGYTLIGGNLRLHPTPQANESQTLKLIYTQKAPNLDIRRAKVSSIISSTQVQFTDIDDNLIDEKVLDYDDKFCIVGSDGTIKAQGLILESLLGTKITYSGDGTSISVGDYLVMGEYASTHSILPDEIEPYLLDYVRMRVYMRDSQDADSSNQSYFTNSTESEIVDMFANNDKDSIHPPITDSDFLSY